MRSDAMRTLLRATLLLALALPAATARAERRFVVTSRSLATVTVDGGRADGLNVGDRLRVLSGSTVVAELEVVSSAERWSSCRVLSLTRPIGTGDVVVPVPRASVSPAPRAAAAPVPPAPAPAPTPRPTPTPQVAAPSVAAPVAAPPVAAPPVAATPASVPTGGTRFNVKYRSAANVYLDGGRSAGLDVGDRLRVVSGKDAVAELEVVYVAEMSASCKVVSETRPVRVGDVAVRLGAPRAAAPAKEAVPAAPPAAAASAGPAPVPTAEEPKPSGPWARVRGSASFGYYKSWDDSESNYDFEERTARLDLGLYDIGGQPLSFTVRGRSREDVRARTLSTRTPQSERTDRLYELALRYEPPSDKLGLEVGRIGIYRFVGVGYLDGFLGRYRPLADVQVGAFGGRIAEIDSLSPDGTGSKYGGFVRLAPGGRWATGGYDVTLAVVRENADGDVSRQYLSLESRFGSGSRWSIFERAELDLNSGWRKEVTGKSTQLSNVSLSGNLRVAPSAWAFVSYDGRRNYRYYQNRYVPEEVFDDLLHTGLRAGLNLSRPGGFGATAGFGMSLKEPDPRHPELDIANAYSGNLGVRHADVFGFSVGLDGTGFTNGYTEGGLVMARIGRRFAAGHLVDLSYGYSTYRVKLDEQDRSTQWLRLLARAELVRRLYVQGDVEYDTGDDLKGPRAFLEVGILF
jgi:hypothetical protein